MKRIESLRRGLEVMELLRDGGPLSLASLSRQSGLAKASLLRILLTMEETGHARRGLGDGLWYPAARAREETDPDRRLSQVSGPPLDRLCQQVLWPSDVGVYHARSIRVLETSRRVSPFLVNRVINYGIHVLPSAMGRAILAWARPGDREAILHDLRHSDEPQTAWPPHPGKVAELIEETRAR
ncbi:helix-turn-helix domain-containing protein, partial [Oceanicola sp. S124]|uniref:helix-turn-helix domain-containing protein n=1 Tax=Oceanicola sp. S124 TaxID=1042378 RepID=UPI0002558591